MVSFSTYPGVFIDFNLKINIIYTQERKEIMDKTIEIPKLTILTKEQVYGDNKLNIFKVIDPKAAVSDTAILRGAYVSNYHVDNDSSLRGRTGYYWLQNSDRDGDVLSIGPDGDSDCLVRIRRSSGVRAALPYSSIQNLPHTIKTRSNGLEEITYGYYPESATNKFMQRSLEDSYNAGDLTSIGTGCIFDGRKYDDYGEDFLPEKQEYFEYNGEIYARIRANSDFDDTYFTLSNEEKYKNGNYVWVKVEPVVWLKHPLDDIMISEKEIIAGVRFDKTIGGYNGDFNTTKLKWFLDNHLSKDILSLDKLKKDINKNNYSDDEIKTINNFIYLNENGKTLKKKKIIVKAKRKSNN